MRYRGRLTSVECGRCGHQIHEGWSPEIRWRWHRLWCHGRITRGLA